MNKAVLKAVFSLLYGYLTASNAFKSWREVSHAQIPLIGPIAAAGFESQVITSGHPNPVDTVS